MSEIDVTKRRILAVDDQEMNLRLLERILRRAGYEEILGTSQPEGVVELLSTWQPDIVLLDLHMPGLNGFEVLQLIRQTTAPAAYLPVLVLTADILPETKLRALEQGASDFLAKPFDQLEALLRIRNLLTIRALQQQVLDQNVQLEERVRVRTAELDEARIDTLDRLAKAAEYRDDATGDHIRRVGELAAGLSRILGWSDDDVALMRRAAPLHDVGKIGVPDSVLLKPGRLTPEEFSLIKTHTTIGARILGGSRVPLLQCAEEIALTHHERWDGLGYNGTRADEIPMSGRIVALVDTFDALTHARPYKSAWTLEETFEEILQQSGRQFDPHIVTAFLDARASLPVEP
ncbi:MAG: HD domain-containing phosphohydrolase [Longimicrobiales bacterium]